MEPRSVYHYQDYRRFLTDWIEAQPSNGHGLKSKIANAIGCHNAYLTQVLTGKADFSSDQAFNVAEFLGLSIEESEHLLLLVQYARAGSQRLKEHYLQKMVQVEQKRNILKNRLHYRKSLKDQDQAIYFSRWYYGVIHLMVGNLPGHQTQASIQAALKLPKKTVRGAFQFLEECKLIEKHGDAYRAGTVNIHIGSDSRLIDMHHVNWRHQAIQSLDHPRPQDLHYSSSLTLNRRDVPKIRELMVGTIEKVRAIVVASTQETDLCVINLDWFTMYSA